MRFPDAVAALAAAVLLVAPLAAQPRLTLDYPAIARRIVARLALKPGERVMELAHPGIFEPLLPWIRYEVMRAGGIDVGVVEVMPEPWPEAMDPAVLTKGARDARAAYKAMFRDVDAAVMMPGATTTHPAYLAMQDWLKEDAERAKTGAGRGRRTVHFHWVENGSAYTLPGQPLPPRYEIDRVYQHALLDTDYEALAALQHRFTEAMRGHEIHVTSPSGTDLRFRIGDRPVNLQDGDASAARTASGPILIDHEIELPAGVVRVAPIEASVEGIVAFPASQWDGRPVEGLTLRFAKGQVVEVTAASGKEAVETEMTRAGAAGHAFREFALGLNPLLAVPDRDPWIPYYGYGAGVVRLSLGDNTELGGNVTGGYVRWNFFTDLTVTVGDTVWVRGGRLAAER